MGGLNFSQILIDCLKSCTPRKLAEADWVLNNVTVDVNAHDEEGRNGTALIQSAYYGLSEWTDKLLARGAKVDDKDCYGRTALWYASLNGHTDVAIKLIKAGANVHIKDNQGTSPIILSTQFETLDLCCLLLGQGAKINDQEVDQKRTPLIVAASSHPTYEKISFLLMAGADVMKKDIYGDTALEIAKAKKADEKVIALLQFRVDEKIKPIQIIRSSDNYEHMAVLYQDQHIKG